MEKIGILGAGGQADEAESYLKDSEVAFNAISSEYIDISKSRQVDILQPNEYQEALPVVAAIGAPATRRKMVDDWKGERFKTIVAELSYVDKTVKIGEGGIIAPRAVITTNVEIGRHAIINVAASVSHNSRLGDFVTVSPGAHIGGNVEIGNGAFIGIGAIISNNVRIAEGCVVGAGAVVIKSVEIPNSVVVGTPARTIRINEDWLYEI